MLGTRGVRLGVIKPGLYAMQVRALMEAARDRVAAGGHPVVEIMIPLTVSRAELALARSWVEQAIAEVEAESPRSRRGKGPAKATKGGGRADVTIGTMIETPRAALRGRPDRRGGRLLLVRHQRPHPDDLRLQPGRRRGPDDGGLPRARPAAPQPLRDGRPRGRGRAGPARRRAGPGHQARAQDRGVRRARRGPRVDQDLLRRRPRLRELLALPGAGGPPGRRPGGPGLGPDQGRPVSQRQAGATSKAGAGAKAKAGSGTKAKAGTGAKAKAGSGAKAKAAGTGRCRGPPLGPSLGRLGRHTRALPSPAMAIPDEDVAQVRAATDIVALIGEHAALRHQGRRWVGLCPFHAEKTPSFSRERRGGVLLLLRLPGLGRRHQLRPRDRAPRLRRRRALPGRPLRGHHPRGRRGGARSQAPGRAVGGHGASGRLVPRAAAGGPRRRAGPRLPALARLRRRRGAPVPPGLGPRRLGRPGQGARALRAGPHRLGPRVRQPPGPGPGRLPGPGDLPDL